MSGKLTKFNLNKQKEMEASASYFQESNLVIPETITSTASLKDHFYNQRFIIQESFTPKKFLWISYKSNIIKTVIPTGLCDECSLPALAHE